MKIYFKNLINNMIYIFIKFKIYDFIILLLMYNNIIFKEKIFVLHICKYFKINSNSIIYNIYYISIKIYIIMKILNIIYFWKKKYIIFYYI